MKSALTSARNVVLTAGLATLALGSVMATPSSAQLDNLGLENIGIGAGASVVTGAVLGDGLDLDDAIGGAAAAAAVDVIGGDESSVVEDAAIGAATTAVVGTILNDDSLWENAIQGGAAGALINILGN